MSRQEKADKALARMVALSNALPSDIGDVALYIQELETSRRELIREAFCLGFNAYGDGDCWSDEGKDARIAVFMKEKFGE